MSSAWYGDFPERPPMHVRNAIEAQGARMHQRLRRQRQHDHGRHRERTERHGATVDDDHDQHHRRHEKRALGRDVAAGQQQIKGRCGQRRGRRPFLDRKCQAERPRMRNSAI